MAFTAQVEVAVLQIDVEGEVSRIIEAADRGVERAAEIVQAKAKELVQTPWPPASSPGHPPHLRTGRLRDSIGTEKVGDAEYVVGPSVDVLYGFYLEFGTSKMASRPFMGPALRDSEMEAKRVIEREIADGLQSK